MNGVGNELGRFVHELPLVCDYAAERELRLRFEVARKLYNALIGEALRRVRRLRHALGQHEALRRACKADANQRMTDAGVHPKSDEAKQLRRAAYKRYNEIAAAVRREHGCSRFALSSYGTKLSRSGRYGRPRERVE